MTVFQNVKTCSKQIKLIKFATDGRCFLSGRQRQTKCPLPNKPVATHYGSQAQAYTRGDPK